MGKVYPTRASFSQSLPSIQTKIPRGLWGPKPKEPLNICHQWRGQVTQAHNLPIWQHTSIFTTFEKQSMINWLSNPINCSVAKISKVMSSSDYIPLGPKSVVPHLITIKNRRFTQNSLSGGSLNYHLGRRGHERHGIGGQKEELRRWLVVKHRDDHGGGEDAQWALLIYLTSTLLGWRPPAQLTSMDIFSGVSSQ